LILPATLRLDGSSDRGTILALTIQLNRLKLLSNMCLSDMCLRFTIDVPAILLAKRCSVGFLGGAILEN